MMVPRLRYCLLIQEHDRAVGLMHEEICLIDSGFEDRQKFVCSNMIGTRTITGNDAVDDASGRHTRNIGHETYLPTIGFYFLSAYHGVECIIPAFDENMRVQELDKSQGCCFAENSDVVHACEGR